MKLSKEAAISASALALTMAGWFIDHADDIGWVGKILAPGYARSVTTYDRMLKAKEPLRAGDNGFREIAEAARMQISGGVDLTIQQLKVTNTSTTETSGDSAERYKQITMEVTFRDGRTIRGNFRDLRPMLKELFFQSKVFRWCVYIFWGGIVLTIISIVPLLRGRAIG
jgi:hypothetical protein